MEPHCGSNLNFSDYSEGRALFHVFAAYISSVKFIHICIFCYISPFLIDMQSVFRNSACQFLVRFMLAVSSFTSLLVFLTLWHSLISKHSYFNVDGYMNLFLYH